VTQRPVEPEEIDEQTKAILTERLKPVDDDAKTARPWREVLEESRQKPPRGFLDRVTETHERIEAHPGLRLSVR
jgi:hypothetical protein